jgi:hypothetical protein
VTFALARTGSGQFDALRLGATAAHFHSDKAALDDERRLLSTRRDYQPAARIRPV